MSEAPVDELDERRKAEIAERLKDDQLELQRIARLQKELKDAREKILERAVPLQRLIGSSIIEGIDGKPYVASVIQAETLQVDAGRLLAALVEQCDGDEAAAEAIWRDVLKPPAVDTKDDGLLYQATKPTDPDDPRSARIWPETLLAAGAEYKQSAPYIGFSKPGG